MENSILDNISEIEACGLTIYGEARGESILGQIAVGCVIRNRVIKFHTSYQEICFKPKQFSCWNEDDPNYPILLELATKLIHNERIKDIALDQCIFLAGGVVNNHLMDVTDNAHNYLTEHLFFHSRPSWASNPTSVKQIDTQIFFNA